MKDTFELGRILKPQGVRGELKAELYTDDLQRVYELPHVLLGDEAEPVKYKVIGARTDGKFAYLMLDGVSDRDTAERFRNAPLYIDRRHAAPIPEGAFYICDLIGLRVQSDDGHVLGTLSDILQNGARDVYVVDRDDGSQLMFPAADGVFIDRNPDAGVITVSAKRLTEVAEL